MKQIVVTFGVTIGLGLYIQLVMGEDIGVFVHPPEMSCQEGGHPDGQWTRPSGRVSISVDGVAECAAKCAGYTYFGLECPHSDTVTCQCANTLEDSTSIADSECNRNRYHCTGPFTVGGYNLGGQGRGSVYLVESLPPPRSSRGCTLDSAVYKNGDLTEDRCIILQCVNGTWEYFDKPDRYAGWGKDCSHCHTTGEATSMRDNHDINGINFKNYNFNGLGTYVFSQLGTAIPSDLIMEIKFEKGNEGKTHTTSVIYKEVGLKVEIAFPSPSQYAYCDDNSNHPNCEAKLLVNGNKITLGSAYGSVATLYGLVGTVFIINRGQTWPWTKQWGHFYIVGSQGTSVRIDYGGWYAVYAVSMAMPSLQNQVYGLCGVWNEEVQTDFTMPNGAVTTDKDEFVRSWLID